VERRQGVASSAAAGVWRSVAPAFSLGGGGGSVAAGLSGVEIVTGGRMLALPSSLSDARSTSDTPHAPKPNVTAMTAMRFIKMLHRFPE
jgi:hypothetical protein